MYCFFGKQVWRGQWQGTDIVAKILKLRECNLRNSRDFKEEFPRLRFVFMKLFKCIVLMMDFEIGISSAFDFCKEFELIYKEKTD